MTVGPQLPIGTTLPPGAPGASLFSAPSAPAASSISVAAQIAGTPAPVAGMSAGAVPMGAGQGVIVSIQPAGTQTPPLAWTTLTITVGGDPTPIAGVRFMSGYTPAVGDTVALTHTGLTVRVDGVLAGNEHAGGGGGFPVGYVILDIFGGTPPAGWAVLDGHNEPTLATISPIVYAKNGNSTVLPDYRDRIPMGAGSTVAVGATAGSATSTALIAHTHTGSGTQPNHTHPGSDSGHTHGQTGTDNQDHIHGFAASVMENTGSSQMGTGGTVSFYSQTSLGQTAGVNQFHSHATGNGTANVSVGSGGNDAVTVTIGSQGSGSSFSILPPVKGAQFLVRLW